MFRTGGTDTDYRSLSWFTMLNDWLATSPQMCTLTLSYIGRHTNKLEVLHFPKSAGLQVPTTQVTNDCYLIDALSVEVKMITKPVPGGDIVSLSKRFGTKSRSPRALQPVRQLSSQNSTESICVSIDWTEAILDSLLTPTLSTTGKHATVKSNAPNNCPLQYGPDSSA
ncbi:hypothetical protein [Nitrosomonas aestuarii]|uniref:hypothetical protein n=1 Tax=Nitrosomonas aestuarii TaxID=52441 RepID=UPI000B8306D2|nr:hypothetical protein [Nitrosomonas aestuarii]